MPGVSPGEPGMILAYLPVCQPHPIREVLNKTKNGCFNETWFVLGNLETNTHLLSKVESSFHGGFVGGANWVIVCYPW